MPLYWLYSARLLPPWPAISTAPDINPKFDCRSFTSTQGVWSSQRNPRLTVRVGERCQSSCKNVEKMLARCPQVPPFTPPPISRGKPRIKSASAKPLPPPEVDSGFGQEGEGP